MTPAEKEDATMLRVHGNAVVTGTKSEFYNLHLDRGTRVMVIALGGEMSNVKLPNGSFMWVPTESLTAA